MITITCTDATINDQTNSTYLHVQLTSTYVTSITYERYAFAFDSVSHRKDAGSAAS